MRNEYLALTLERPADPERLGLLAKGAWRRFNAKTGLSRTARHVGDEGFNQFTRPSPSSSKNLECALTRHGARGTPAGSVRWGCRRAVRSHQELHRARNVADSGNSPWTRSRRPSACRTEKCYRAFKADPAGSISNYVWLRRLKRACGTDGGGSVDHRHLFLISWLHLQLLRIFSRLFHEYVGSRLANTGRRSNNRTASSSRRKHAPGE